MLGESCHRRVQWDISPLTQHENATHACILSLMQLPFLVLVLLLLSLPPPYTHPPYTPTQPPQPIAAAGEAQHWLVWGHLQL